MAFSSFILIYFLVSSCRIIHWHRNSNHFTKSISKFQEREANSSFERWKETGDGPRWSRIGYRVG